MKSARDPGTGKRLWFAKTDIPGNICPLVVSDGDFLFTTGGHPKKGSLVLKGGGSGDVTDKILWKSKSYSYLPTPVIKDALYLHSNEAVYCVAK